MDGDLRMAFAEYIGQIRTATYGWEVREAIASAIEECYSDIGDVRVTIQNILDTVDGNLAEYVRARVDELKPEIMASIGDAKAEVLGSVTGVFDALKDEMEIKEGDLRGYVLFTASVLRTEYANSASALGSAIEQTASHIFATVYAANSQLYSIIEATATNIRQEVKNTISGFYSLVEQTDEYYRVSLSNSESTIYSDLTVTKDMFRSRIVNLEEDVQSQIQQLADMIRSEVSANDSKYYSYIEQTATYILSVVENVESKLGSSIYQSESRIYSELHANDSLIYSYVDRTATYVVSVVEDSENKMGSTILQTASQIYSELHANDSKLYSYVDQTATYIHQVVEDSENRMGSAILQTSSQIRSEVHANDSQIYSYINQTATHIHQVVEDSENRMGSAILETSSQIRSEVHANDSQIYSYINQTATHIHQVVENAESRLGAAILVTESQIRSEVHANDSQIYSYINQTATHIHQVVENTESRLGAAILMTESQIYSEVHAANSALYSYVDQTSTQIRQVVTDTKEGLHSEILQTSSKIALVVSDDDKIKVASIVAAINESGESEARINAEKVYIGDDKSTTVIAGKTTMSQVEAKIGEFNFVTADSLEAKIANFGYLKTANLSGEIGKISSLSVMGLTVSGSLQANSNIIATGNVKCATLEASVGVHVGGKSLTNCFNGVSSSEADGQVTLTFDRFNGAAAGTVTFSTAAAGWAKAVAKIALPETGDGESFSLTVPAEAYDTDQSYTFTMSKGTPATSGYASVVFSGTTTAVAKIDISDWYTSGRTQGRNDVTVSQVWNEHTLTVTKTITGEEPSVTSYLMGIMFDSLVSDKDGYGNFYVTVNGGTQGSTFSVNCASIFNAGKKKGQDDSGVILDIPNKAVKYATSSATKSYTISSETTLSYDSETHKYTASGKAKADSSSLATSSAVSGVEAYNAGKTDGANSIGLTIDISEKQVKTSAGSTTKYLAVKAKPEISYDSATHKYTAKATAQVGSSTVDTDTEDSGTEAYDAGKKDANDDGWTAAVGKLSRPAAGTSSLFSATVPGSKYDTASQWSFSVTKDSPSSSGGYANVWHYGSVVGRVDISNWYTSGRTQGQKDVTVTQTWSGRTLTVSKNTPSGTTSTTYEMSIEWDSAHTADNYGNFKLMVNGNKQGTAVAVNCNTIYQKGVTAGTANGRTLGRNDVSVVTSWSGRDLAIIKRVSGVGDTTVQTLSFSVGWNSEHSADNYGYFDVLVNGKAQGTKVAVNCNTIYQKGVTAGTANGRTLGRNDVSVVRSWSGRDLAIIKRVSGVGDTTVETLSFSVGWNSEHSAHNYGYFDVLVNGKAQGTKVAVNCNKVYEYGWVDGYNAAAANSGLSNGTFILAGSTTTAGVTNTRSYKITARIDKLSTSTQFDVYMARALANGSVIANGPETRIWK